MSYDYDVIIIGAGSAGLSAAEVCKKNNAEYLLIEKGPGGSTCARQGCMPSKALIEAANIFHTRKKFKNFHISGGENLSVDVAGVLSHVREMRDGFVQSVIDSMNDHPVLHGAAKFIDTHTLRVDDKEYSAHNIIICTGSKPLIPDIFADFEDKILTTDNLFEQDDLPDSIAVIGMGSIGAEMSQALARLGIEIFAFESTESVMGIVDHDINQKAQEVLERDMRLYMGANIQKLEPFNGHYRLITENRTIEMSGILICAGRVPDLEGLELQSLDIELTDDGVPEFDTDTLKVKDQPIYIAGDANDHKAYLHEAHVEATRAAEHALGIDLSRKPVTFTIAFTKPDYAVLGNIRDKENTIGKASYENQARARMKGDNVGRVNIHAHVSSGALVGAEIFAPAGEHMAHFLYLAIENKMRAQDLLDLPFYHPTLEEGLRPALKEIVDQLSD